MRNGTFRTKLISGSLAFGLLMPMVGTAGLSGQDPADAEAYMDQLGLSQEEREWMAQLCSMVEEGQRADGPSGGTDYGDIVFTDAETPVVYYNQRDAR